MPVDPYIARGFQSPARDYLDEYYRASENRRRETQLQQESDRRDEFAAMRRMQYSQDQSDRSEARQAALSAQEQQWAAAAIGNLAQADPQSFELVKRQLFSDPRGLAILQKLGARPEDVTPQNVQAVVAAMRTQQGIAPPEVGGGIKIGQYNPGDYTPQSWAGFLQSQDPSGLQRQYAPPAPPNMTLVQLPGGQAAFNPRTAGLKPISSREDQRAAEVADVAAVEAAKTSATAGTEQQVKGAERSAALRLYEAARAGLISGLEGSRTGPVSGRIPAVTAAQQTAEGGVAAMAPVLKQLFRVAGEGVFTDRDQALLLDMVPKRTDLPEARAAKMANIDAIVRAKLQQPPAAPPQAPPSALEYLRQHPETAAAFEAKYGYRP